MAKHSGQMVNPGAGKVAGKNLKSNAIENISKLLADVGGESSWEYVKKLPCGRFSFIITLNGAEREVDIPGLPLEEVRYMDPKTQDIWDFDRLYVDGSSWVWKYAVDVLKREDSPK